MSVTVSEGIEVRVVPEYWEEHSSPHEGEFAFAYTVSLRNLGSAPARLRSRHWIITDATGHVEEVGGEGVVGETPNLDPGDTFEYTSWVMLRTPFGTMRGAYQMVRPDGARFEAQIGEFLLAEPNALH